MNQTTIQALAQELVDMQRQLRNIEDQKLLIKLELWDNAKNGIQCDGGVVYWVEPGTIFRFNTQVLREVLSKYDLNEEEINTIVEQSKIPYPREANILVRLTDVD